MVVFGDHLSSTDQQRQCRLEQQLAECMQLQERLSKANQQLTLDPRFIQKVVKALSHCCAVFNVCVCAAECQRRSSR